MGMKLVGFEKSAGTFTSEKTGKEIDYNNVKFYCEEQFPENDPNGIGAKTKEFKVKNDENILFNVFNAEINAKRLQYLIGKTLEVYYTEKTQVSMIVCLEHRDLEAFFKKKEQDEVYPDFDGVPLPEELPNPPKGKK